MNGTKNEDEVGKVTDGQIEIVAEALKRLGWEPLSSQPVTPWGETTFGRLTGLTVFIFGLCFAVSCVIDALKR
jgi:hypothetical protein